MQAGHEPKLSLDTEFGIGEAAFSKVVADVASISPKVLVEFGAGASSFRFADALPDVNILSIDHDTTYFREEQARLQSMHAPPPKLRFELRPLRRQRFRYYVYTTYSAGAFPPDVDAVLVDGPPYWACRGREACLHQIAPFLRVGARVYLDDTKRPAESRISTNWLRAYPNLRLVSALDVGHGVNVFEVMAPLGRPRFDPMIFMDHIGARVSKFRGYVSSRIFRGGRGVPRSA